jgi:hypothetical protein
MSVTLRHPQTGEVKVLQEGWSWGCFLGCGILGLPLFRRGLQVWGSVMLVFNIVVLIVGFGSTASAATLYFWLTVIGIGACVFFGMKANRMAIDRYVSFGWEPAGSGRNLPR